MGLGWSDTPFDDGYSWRNSGSSADQNNWLKHSAQRRAHHRFMRGEAERRVGVKPDNTPKLDKHLRGLVCRASMAGKTKI